MTAPGLQLLNLLHYKLQHDDIPEIRRPMRQVAMTFAGPLTPDQRIAAEANTLVAMAKSPAHSFALDLILIVALSKELA